MKHFNFRRLLFTAACLLVGSLATYAADDDLITQQVTITLDEAGTLPDKISDTKKYKITNLKIIGKINGTDLKMIRDMAGCSFYINDRDESVTNRNLSILNLREAHIVYDERNAYCEMYWKQDGKTVYHAYYVNESDVIPVALFYYSKSLTSIFLPLTTTKICPDAFSACTGLTNISNLSNVTSIGDGAFSGCTGLTGISIPSNITSIGNNVFSGCTGLTGISFPNVRSIGDGAFSGCTGLTSISIPSNVTSIGNNVFSGCTGLTSVIVFASVTSLDGTFSGCTELTSVIRLPSSVTSLDGTFSGCTGLTSITLPSSVTSLDGTFSGCTGLTSIKLPSSVKEIGSNAFYDCTQLANIMIRSGVKSIGSYAFSGCTGLTSITLPASITEIGSYAFLRTGLTSVYASWYTPISISTSVFGDIAQTCTLYVPKGTSMSYFVADVWGDFQNIIEIETTGVEGITMDGDAMEVARYNLSGARLTAPQRGINVVRMSDGSTKKVLVK